MQTTFEVAKLFHFHTCETKINLFLRLSKNPNENFVSKLWCCRINVYIYFFSKCTIFQKEKIENISVNQLEILIELFQIYSKAGIIKD